MRDFFDLIYDGFDHVWIRVTNACRQHAAEAIQIFVAGVVPHVHALPAFERERFLVIHGDGRK